MGAFLLIFSSSTTAGRLKRIAAKSGYAPVNLVQTPKSISENGCSYALKVSGAHLSALKALAEEYGLKVNGIYRELMGTDGLKSYERYV